MSNAHNPIIDPIQAGLHAGWKVIDAATLTDHLHLETDVVVIGTGAGGGVTAEILVQAGLKVIMIEEGALKSSKDFKMREAEAYPALYQESGARKTKDKGINILQGRTVGGSTTINWTSSFRTPPDTLRFWQSRFGLHDYTSESMALWFAMMEKRLNVSNWESPSNENNAILRRGAKKLQIPTAAIPRNVKGCWNLGYCGMGCPTNAKQSMLVTTIPVALMGGATLVTHARAHNLHSRGHSVDELLCHALNENGLSPTGKSITIKARHYVVCGGAINTPALLMRSSAPDPYQLLGKRTFLHPTVISAAIFAQSVDGFAGAPQTVYSDHFMDTQPIDGPIGYKLEVPPLHPLLFSTTMAGFGEEHSTIMKQFAHTQVILALLRDGFHEQSVGGIVQLREDGYPVLDYTMSDVMWDGVKRALLTMAEIQFAAGAQTVYPIHEMASGYKNWATAKQAIANLPYQTSLTRVVSAHVMGGCPMSPDTRLGLVSAEGLYHGLDNVSVHDGSLFPTSIGANPQLSIYGITARLATGLAAKLSGNKSALSNANASA